jgi:hypothetical protein
LQATPIPKSGTKTLKPQVALNPIPTNNPVNHCIKHLHLLSSPLENATPPGERLFGAWRWAGKLRGQSAIVGNKKSQVRFSDHRSAPARARVSSACSKTAPAG